MIYVFDTESRHFSGRGDGGTDMTIYKDIIDALASYSPEAHVFCLIHKMDLVPLDRRDEFQDVKEDLIQRCSPWPFKSRIRVYGTSIWDETLYAAWGDIVQCLTPNLPLMQDYINKLAEATRAEEVILFERATFLRVLHATTALGEENP